MTPESWRQVSALVDELLDQPPAVRAERLDRLCPDDSGLRIEVERMLRADDEAGAFLSGGFDQVAAWIDDVEGAPARERGDPLCGATVGPYRVIREIGRGGMGVVFLAERADGAFDQQVALKVVHRWSSSESERHRFFRERRILAQLDHPSIARVFDGGVTADGRPYFAMEYVDGEAITAYCANRALGTEDRIRLYLDVCLAVEAAHQHLIVHRDLKPSNILVSRDGRVKLLDFGIAKPLDRDAFLTVTQTGEHPMTPEYAAPEHVRRGPITVMTDVYGLGLVLYEVLTGDRPFRSGRPLELAAAVVAEEPLRPSAVVGAAALRRRLRGDLDTIVLTAMRKEPERRYASAGALRSDLERFLRRQPILARADSVGYRARRFAQRHRAGVAATAVVALSLVAGISGVLWQAKAALQQARRVEAVKTFMSGVFRLSDPSEAAGQTLKAREILDLAARRVDTELADAPEIQADMLTLMGRIYTQVGLYQNAAPLLERGLELRRRLRTAGPAEIGDSLDALGVLQTREGHFTEAERTLAAALDAVGRRPASDSGARATVLNHLGAVQLDRSDHRAAVATIQEALAIRKTLLGNRHPAVAESLDLLAQVRRALGDLDGATALDRQALDIRRAQFGPDHPDVISSLGSLALDAFDKAQYRDAAALYAQALDAAGRTLGPDHPDTLQLRTNLAAVMAQQGQVADSERMLRETIAAMRRRLGESHPTLVGILNNLAMAERRLGRLDEAERIYRETLSMAERELGPAHVEVAKNLNDLAMLVKEQGHLDEAEALVQRSIPILTGALGEAHSYVGRATMNLARIQVERRLTAQAEESYRRALTILRGSLPAGHNLIADAASGLGRLLTQDGRPGDAEPLLREALASLASTYDEADERTTDARLALGECLLAQGRSAEARPLLDASYQALLLAHGSADTSTRRAGAARQRAWRATR